MHARKSRLTILMAVMALAMTLGTTGAAADGALEFDAPATAHCEGTADVWTGPDPFDPTDPDEQGLTFPHVDGSRDFNFELNTECTVVASNGIHSSVNLTARGTGTGWCGHSTSPSNDPSLHHAGTNDGELGEHDLDDIEWVSAGSVLAITLTHDAGGLGVGTAEVQAFGGEDCNTLGGSTSFNVVIAAELL